MSAIGGIVRFDGRPVERSDLDRVASALRMYGPDRAGVVVSERVGLVNMLMRITPEDAFERQPTRGASGALITADLRLDNRDALAARLGVSLAEAATWPDSRIVLAAWEAFGDAIWPEVRGPFVAAIWQPNTRTLRLVRDPIGVNVVMFYKCADFFAFASMPKGLFALPGVPRALNEEKLADFMVLNHADLETTFYKNIFRLPPAHLAIVKGDGAITQRRYWSADDVKSFKLGTDAEYADGLRETLDRAVRRQLRCALPIGCYLTGGLDSSSVAALASGALDERGERLSVYTQTPRVGFAGPTPAGTYADETPFVEAIASMIDNLDVNYVRSDEHDDFELLERFFLAFEGPVRNPTNLGWMIGIPRLARSQGRRALLGAQAGNYTISWDGWSQSFAHARSGRFLTAYRQYRQFYQASSLSLWGAARKLFVQPLMSHDLALRAYKRRKREQPWAHHAAIRPDYAARSQVDARARALEHDFLYFNRPNERRDGLISCDYLGDWNAALKASCGVEIRDPTADLDVIAYCFGAPPEQFLADGIDRSLIRRAMWGRLPPKVLSSRLRGLQSADWFERLGERRTKFASEIAEIASSSALVRDMVDVERLQRDLATWPDKGWQYSDVASEYHLALSRGVAMARFVSWFEGGNRRPDLERSEEARRAARG